MSLNLSIKPETKLEQYNYYLPERFIAQVPLETRDQSKMLVLDKKSGKIKHDFFYNINDYLSAGDMLVLNESRVIKCRLVGIKKTTGAKIECFILNQTGKGKEVSNRCQVLLKPSKRLKTGDVVLLEEFFYVVIEKQQYGKVIVEFSENPGTIMVKYGKVPLPPYINNDKITEDRYQTIYARVNGSAAAPTAGFHLTEQIIETLGYKGISFAKLCLNIGLDTFRPIVEENIEEHIIHKEGYFLSKSAAEKIMNVKKNGGRVIAVGTTTTRVLETVAGDDGMLRPGKGKTGLYIYPGYKFKAVDGLITNFHLPRSTLLVMVSAFAGRKNILNAYEDAKANNYRFFSFGDCMLII